MLVYARLGQQVVMAHISSPMLERYEICICLARLAWFFWSGSPTAALDFFSHLSSEGNGVDQFGEE